MHVDRRSLQGDWAKRGSSRKPVQGSTGLQLQPCAQNSESASMTAWATKFSHRRGSSRAPPRQDSSRVPPRQDSSRAPPRVPETRHSRPPIFSALITLSTSGPQRNPLTAHLRAVRSLCVPGPYAPSLLGGAAHAGTVALLVTSPIAASSVADNCENKLLDFCHCYGTFEFQV